MTAADQGALFLAEGSDALALDGLEQLATTPIDELDLPRELAPGVIARPTTAPAAPEPEPVRRYPAEVAGAAARLHGACWTCADCGDGATIADEWPDGTVTCPSCGQDRADGVPSVKAADRAELFDARPDCVTCGEPVTLGDDLDADAGRVTRWGPCHDGCETPDDDEPEPDPPETDHSHVTAADHDAEAAQLEHAARMAELHRWGAAQAAARRYCGHRGGCGAVATVGALCAFHAADAPAADLFATINTGRCDYGTPKIGEPRPCDAPATHVARWATYASHPDDERDERTGGIACCLEHANYYASAWGPQPFAPGARGAAWLEPLA